MMAKSKKDTQLYIGQPDAIMLEGFHWKSHEHPWYRILKDNAAAIREAGFDYVWFPPSTASADKQGYLPTEWYNLNSAYGSQTELAEAIEALNPIGALADIVVNHRCGLKDWADFRNPHFAPTGTTDPLTIDKANRQAVVQNDEWKDKGGHPEGTYDSGDNFDGGRDLDYTNPQVQKMIIEWLLWMKKEIGFSGWRWDMVKGYHPSFVGLFNDATRPEFSVAEFADNRPDQLIDWINRSYGKEDGPDGQPDRTGGKSCVFDFSARDLLRKAIKEKNFACMKSVDGKSSGLIGRWPLMAITFLENHDTEPANHDDPFPTEYVPAGYAYLMTHPGRPCVFWCHFFDWKEPLPGILRRLMQIRRTAGLHATSTVSVLEAKEGLYAAVADEKVAVKIGPAPWNPPGQKWEAACDGPDFAVWQKNKS
jgi:alpha-amylase